MSAIGDKIVNNLQSFVDSLKHKKFEEITPQEARQLWIDDLRTTKEKQGTIYLCRVHNDGSNSFCCLGRAMEVFIKAGGKLNKIPDKEKDDFYEPENFIRYDGEAGGLTEKVRRWFGIRSTLGEYGIGENESSLSKKNDCDRLTFVQIADIIESEPERLLIQSEKEV